VLLELCCQHACLHAQHSVCVAACSEHHTHAHLGLQMLILCCALLMPCCRCGRAQHPLDAATLHTAALPSTSAITHQPKRPGGLQPQCLTSCQLSFALLGQPGCDCRAVLHVAAAVCSVYCVSTVPSTVFPGLHVDFVSFFARARQVLWFCYLYCTNSAPQPGPHPSPQRCGCVWIRHAASAHSRQGPSVQ
jgi:hypothetical protein